MYCKGRLQTAEISLLTNCGHKVDPFLSPLLAFEEFKVKLLTSAFLKTTKVDCTLRQWASGISCAIKIVACRVHTDKAVANVKT